MKIKNVIVFLLVLLMVGCQKSNTNKNSETKSNIADKVFTNGKIYTVNEKQPWAEALAIKGNKIIFVGSNYDAKILIGENTKVIKLNGKMMLPGLNDTHTHVRIGGQMNSVMLNLFDVQGGRKSVLEAIKKYADGLEPDEWVLGTGWMYDDFNPPPTRQELDAVTGGRPATISSESQHTGWYNTKALEHFGITNKTPNPPGGIIVRDKQGVATGVLQEKAQIKYGATATPKLFTKEQQETALKKGIDMLNQEGITSIIDAAAESKEGADNVYKRLKDKGELNARADLALLFIPSKNIQKSIDKLLIRHDEGNDLLKIRTIKLFVDGIPGKTALMFKPYNDGTQGLANYKQEQLNTVINTLTENGFRIMVHCQGDKGITMTINAFEYADKTGEPLGKDHYNMLTHLDHLRLQDIPRMKALGLIAQIQPHWPSMSRYTETVTKPQVGAERFEKMYPFAELNDAGVMLTAGADWPTGPIISPWTLIETGITRQEAGGKTPVFPGKKLNLNTLIRAFTINGAKLMFNDKFTGSLEVGKKADLIVINQNLFEIPVTDIHKTKVLLTMLDGKPVYGDLISK